MRYSKEELIKLYRQSKNQETEKNILMDLGMRTESEIVEMLREHGYYIHMFKGIDMELHREEIESHFANGGSLSQLSAIYKSDNNSMKKMLNSMGIETPKRQGPKNVSEKMEEKVIKERNKPTYENAIKMILDMELNFTSGSALAYIVKAATADEAGKRKECLLEAKNFLEIEIEHMS